MLKPKSQKENNQLYVESQILDMLRSRQDKELVYLKNGLLRVVDYPTLLKFEFNDGKAVSVTQIRDNLINK